MEHIICSYVVFLFLEFMTVRVNAGECVCAQVRVCTYVCVCVCLCARACILCSTLVNYATQV